MTMQNKIIFENILKDYAEYINEPLLFNKLGENYFPEVTPYETLLRKTSIYRDNVFNREYTGSDRIIDDIPSKNITTESLKVFIEDLISNNSIPNEIYSKHQKVFASEFKYYIDNQIIRIIRIAIANSLLENEVIIRSKSMKFLSIFKDNINMMRIKDVERIFSSFCKHNFMLSDIEKKILVKSRTLILTAIAYSLHADKPFDFDIVVRSSITSNCITTINSVIDYFLNNYIENKYCQVYYEYALKCLLNLYSYYMLDRFYEHCKEYQYKEDKNTIDIDKTNLIKISDTLNKVYKAIDKSKFNISGFIDKVLRKLTKTKKFYNQPEDILNYMKSCLEYLFESFKNKNIASPIDFDYRSKYVESYEIGKLYDF